ncbi:TIGR01777 family oxidoreductase [Brevibacterium salitolerans]|uniref:TIGR01777 family oxidoreductase n=1 Tax=Brevibacterium salitolerans TaxID=1403566 RepID=A0ABN2X8A8_9MICO
MTAPRTLVLTGASGYIGRHLHRRFTEDGWTVRTIGRSPRGRGAAAVDAAWDDDLTPVLDGADALVNLAGRSVSCRYTKRTADEILRSRTETTKRLGLALAACASPPPVWLNASTGTIYRDARDRPQTEAAGELGTGFSVAVARAWEQELFDAPVDEARIRRVALRTSIVMGPGGALNPMVNLARMGFGGRQGDGGQMLSWIHIEDVHRAVRHLIDRPDLSGPVNLASPHPVTNREFMALTRARFGGLGTRLGLPLPAWSLEAGARIIRTEAELVLKSRWVAPEKLLAGGFAFRFPHAAWALDDIAAQTPSGLLPVQLG